jgi:anti-anti-sigma factor
MPEVSFPVDVVSGVPVVTAPEEIDITNAAGLRTALLEAAGHGNGTLAVDMSQTKLCDSSGINVLVRAHQQAQAQAERGEVLLIISAAAVLRMLALIGVDRMIPNFATLDEALGQVPAYAVQPPVSTI